MHRLLTLKQEGRGISAAPFLWHEFRADYLVTRQLPPAPL